MSTPEIPSEYPREPNRPQRSTRLLCWAGVLATVGIAGNRLEHRSMPASWRGDGGLWDVASHIGNVPGSIAVVGASTLIVAQLRHHLFSETTLKKAASTAAIALAIGCSANAVFETPSLYTLPVIQEQFPDLQPDPLDELYGDIASLATATLLAGVMSTRRQLEATPLAAAEIPRLPHSDNG